MGVLTPWYPSAREPWSGTFVAGMTEALTPLARVHVVHVTVRGRAPVPRLVAVEQEGLVTRISAAGPPGGWGLRTVARAVGPHVPEGIPLVAHAPVPAGVLASQAGQPYAVVLHGIDAFGARQRWGTRPVAGLSRRVLEGSSAIVAVSDRVRRALPDPLAARTQVVHNGVNGRIFHARDRADFTGPVRLLSVGNLGPGKGHDVVLEALPGLVERHRGLQWEVVGEGRLRSSLERRARHLGVDEAVTFTGRLSPIEVAERMRAAHVFVLPATYEALGCVFLEAMACGLPVVAARGEGIGEVVRHGVDGLLVNATPVAVSAAVRGLLASPARASHIGGEAARRAAEFDWRCRAVQLWDVLQEMAR